MSASTRIASQHQSAARARLYKLLAVANRELGEQRVGWSEDDYRFILQQCGATWVDGRCSARTMSIPQMSAALARFKALGFRVRSPRPNTPGDWRAPRIAKLNAIWCALADAGKVRDGSQRAMEHFCRRHLNGLERLQWATSEQLNQCVEMLKQFAARVHVAPSARRDAVRNDAVQNE